MRYKTFDNPHSHDTEWYLNRESADHINENGHRPRLLKVQEYLLELVKNNVEYTICDFGCGNGGLMREIESKISNEIWGYDLCPANVKDANKKTVPSASTSRRASVKEASFNSRMEKHPLARNAGESSAEGKYRLNRGKSIPKKRGN
jgi:2-polyprenyl-3-methyl-5-hydroxy-6-metoxy-1,4-benzoquinol methylase